MTRGQRLPVPAAALALLLLCVPVAATGGDRPVFSTCIDTQVSYFERDFPPMSEQPANAAFETGNYDWVDFCGMQGIVHCDLSEDRFDCQRALRAEQDAMRERLLAGLPDPDQVKGRAGEVSDALYPRLWALAHGTSAGADCAGAQEAMEVWCEAREANGRLRIAVLTWQVARFLGAAASAVEAGWASPPPPMRPRVRPEAQK